ncbi:beta-phosphoglucomutase [Antarcticibacterium arcticum]|uniref:Beta-phosphoglucomutase n=1 Tax=Antarcticibacterium arcticum TaxID=2585771 RepID=A0A5B8YJ73_9FLAO|nr:beta-phosphoglucomutase [Antarcticibacterium arcticum]QED36436.1 beta-phosphoglucomutase [Antarcticibacterium arcticum]
MYKNKGIIFDLDGVIVDTAKFHYLAWRKLANDLGFDITEEQNEELKGVSRVRSLEKILDWGNVKLSQDNFMEQMALKNDNYLSYISTMTQKDILPGVQDVLNFFTENNIPIALGSASKNARSILEKTGLHQKFTAVVDGNDVEKAKPDPEVFLIAAEKLGIEPVNCIVFEDSQAGVQAANIAGMISIGIGSKEVLHEADYVFANFEEIEMNFLKKLLTQ